MSNIRYLEIDSTYRNRNEYPSPANFVVEISQSGIRNALQAVDPISVQAIQEIWNGSFDNSVVFATVTLSVPPFLTGVGTPTDPTEILISAPAGTLRTEEDFYAGAVLEVVSAGITYSRRIQSYKFVTSGAVDEALITLSTPFPDSVLSDAAATGTISSPQDPTDTVRPTVFIPSGVNISNYYLGCVITNRTRSETRTIVEYLFDLRLAVLDSPAPTWLATDDYTIAKETPCDGGYPVSPSTFVAVNANGRVFQLPLTATSNSNAYAGGFLRLDSLIGGGLPPAPFSAPPAPYNEIRRIVRYIALDATFVTVGGSAFSFSVIDPPEGIEQQFYVGAFITTPIATYQIATFDLATLSGTIVGVFGAEVPGTAVSMRSVIIDAPFTVLPLVATTLYQIECFTTDNAVPFNYTGSLVSQSQMVCYEIELLNLILPNRTLNVSLGGRIAFYPFVYVELQNVSGSSRGNPGVIYSNNPNSTRMLFRAAVDDTPTPLISPFIKIDGDGMVQTVKFKPNDSLQFSVRMPGGEVFSVVDPEDFGPQKANPLIQISAMFSIKRL